MTIIKFHPLGFRSNYVKWPAPPSPYSPLRLPWYSLSELISLSGWNNSRSSVAKTCWTQGTCEKEAALYTDARSHVMHILLKEGGQLLQSTRSPFQTGLCSLNPRAAGSNYLPGQDTAVQLASDSIMVQGRVKQVTASPGSYKQQTWVHPCAISHACLISPNNCIKTTIK